MAELVARGRASSDSFAGLRALLGPTDRKRPRGRRRSLTRGRAVEEAGRWTALTPAPGQASKTSASRTDPGALETAAWALLRRYGVVFRAVLTREPGWLPPWRELVGVYRRLEDRGEVRGGRFVAGFWGEQFALPEAVSELRRVRRREPGNRAIVVPASDPLNLVGILTPGERVPAVAGNRVLFRDGIPCAARMGGRLRTPTGDQPAEEDRRLLTGARPVST